jgi:hypothetical protein
VAHSTTRDTSLTCFSQVENRVGFKSRFIGDEEKKEKEKEKEKKKEEKEKKK